METYEHNDTSPPLDNPPGNLLVNVRTNAGYTQEELAESAGMSRNAIIRYEQALYVHPSTAYLDALVSLKAPVGEVRTAYMQHYADCYRGYRHERISSTVKQFSGAVETNKWLIGVQTKSPVDVWKVHPFVSFRRMLAKEKKFPDSQVHFCVLTCFHPGQLAAFENGKTRTIPDRLKEILLSAGIRVDILEREIEIYLRSD